ncbi:ATP-binding protein [Actinoallomurus sp. NPDC050550]|uniref:ATP-binding protein n=1 Tax=Actinoallomurus sp. NPDC050550 TaxID=3154937 RepID=UPI0033D26E8C
MSGCEAEGGEAAAGVLEMSPVGLGDVGPEFQDADGEVSQGGHDGGASAGADLGGVFAVGDVAYVVEGFDLPLAADPGGEFVGPGLVGGEAGDGVDGGGRGFAAVAGPGLAGDGDGLGGVVEQQPFGQRDDLETAAFGPAVSGRVDTDLAEDAILVTSELVTNAIAHGAAPVTLTVTERTEPERTVILDVADASPDLPVQDLPGEVGHFGLWIAEELARVTIHPTTTGKTVRAEFILFDQPATR